MTSSKGPSDAGDGAETDTDPSRDDVRQSVAWALENDHVELVDFHIDLHDTGEPAPCLQLVGGPYYNVTGLDEDMLDQAREMVIRAGGDPEDIDVVLDDDGGHYFTAEVDASLSDHQALVEDLLAEVYGVSPEEVASITRSAVAHSDEELSDVPEPAATPAGIREQCEELGVFDFADSDSGAVVDLDTEISLDALKLAFGLYDHTYEPAVYPAFALTRSVESGRVTILAFESGRICAVDAPSEDAAVDAVQWLVEEIAALDIHDLDVPSRDEITVDTTT